MAPHTASSQPPLPRRLLKDLLVRSQITPGCRVLDLGCGDGRLVEWLNLQGVDALGFRQGDPAPVSCDAPQSIRVGNPAAAFPFPQHCFNLILGRDLDCYLTPKSTPELFITTANVLSSLTAGGKLVILEPLQPNGEPDSARIEWLIDHFSWFPVQCLPRQYAEKIGWFLTLGFLRERKLDQWLITITAPTPNPSRLEWHRLACQIAQTINTASRNVA